MPNDSRVFGQGAKVVRFDPMLILLGPTRIAFACGATIRAFLDGSFADGVRDHVRGLFVSGGEVNLVSQVQ